MRPLVNLKPGMQCTIYTQFNRASRNYDGFGCPPSIERTVGLRWAFYRSADCFLRRMPSHAVVESVVAYAGRLKVRRNFNNRWK